MMWFILKNNKAILSLTLTAGLCLSLGFIMTGCKESAPPAKPAVVKKRIEQTTPATKAAEPEKAAPAAKTAGPKATEATPASSETAASETGKPGPSVTETAPARTSETAREQEEAAASSETALTETATVQETQQGDGTTGETETVSLKSSLFDNTFPKYDPTGKIDPFAPLFSKESETDLSDDGKPKRPLTPLERVDISQLKLVAVLLAESGNRAMVEDATGKPYVLTPGTYIGINSGTVTRILKDRVVIEEKSKDFLGRESANTRELKLQKPFGEE